eukprot:CAMPEP_0184263344 /NCGR_PEP_ID=MMETSP0977-20130417/18542_1 /TAXON_ID=483370 /ORGANISM="non described non described, Strain CCMP2097" /LENGTH=150 /DNA_ID=CAMNT_0026569045 /DNA_START=90 /DNA_END=539 /DNA_ORIENTATION=+
MVLFCVCGDDGAASDGDDDARLCSSLPPALNEAIMFALKQPRDLLGVGGAAPPWVLRDALRRKYIEMLGRREHFFEAKVAVERKDDDAPDGRATIAVPYRAAAVAFTLLEAEARGKAADVAAAMPKLLSDDYFAGAWPPLETRRRWGQAA